MTIIEQDIYYCYIAECADGTYYTGYTTDIINRTKVHNEGKGGKYTRSRLPIRIVYSEKFTSKSDAMKREAGIKRLSRDMKAALIASRKLTGEEKVLELYNWLKENGISIWIAGGWGVDALLGRQTREHADLDIAVQRQDNAKLRRLLENNGYIEEKQDDSSDFMYVLRNEVGQKVDIHVFEYDENGNIIYGIEFPFGSLTGTGMIGGQEVNCIDPKYMFQFITWYEPKEKDLHDIRALSEKYGFELP